MSLFAIPDAINYIYIYLIIYVYRTDSIIFIIDILYSDHVMLCIGPHVIYCSAELKHHRRRFAACKNKMHAKISTHASLCVYDSKFELCRRGVLLFILNQLL